MTKSLTVLDAPPPTFGQPTISSTTLNEGSSTTLSVTASQNIDSWTINWGDGITETISTYSTSLNTSHTYADDESGAADDKYQIQITANTMAGSWSVPKKDGQGNVVPLEVTVTNVAPTLAANLTSTSILPGESVTVSGTLSDTGTMDWQNVVVNWGDGSPEETLVVNGGMGQGTVNGSHTYNSKGTRTVQVFAWDDDMARPATATWSATVTVNNRQPYFTTPEVTFPIPNSLLADGQVLGTIVADDLDEDPLTYDSTTDLSEIGLQLVPTVLVDGRSAATLMVVDWFKLWNVLAEDPGFTLDVTASDCESSATQLIHFGIADLDEFLGFTKGGGGTTPPAWSAIPGYPAALPAATKVKVIIATRGVHSFVILLDSFGGSTCYSGTKDAAGKLVASSGNLGTYESYRPENMTFQVLPGEYDRGAVTTSMTGTVGAINALGNNYFPQTNNCHCTSTALLQRAGIGPLPATADAAGKIGANLGWTKLPDGL